jgi:hypothetical protein
MHIGWVGRLERNDATFEQLAATAGHKLGFHTGDVRGQGAEALRRLVKSSSFVIILTTVNSHGDVQLAKRVARKQNCPSAVMQHCDRSRFRQLLAAIDPSMGRGIASETVAYKIQEGGNTQWPLP